MKRLTTSDYEKVFPFFSRVDSKRSLLQLDDLLKIILFSSNEIKAKFRQNYSLHCETVTVLLYNGPAGNQRLILDSQLKKNSVR